MIVPQVPNPEAEAPAAEDPKTELRGLSFEDLCREDQQNNHSIGGMDQTELKVG